MTKTFTSCNWVGSRVTKEDLNNFVQTSILGIHWRVPGTEYPPEPKEGEVIVLLII